MKRTLANKPQTLRPKKFRTPLASVMAVSQKQMDDKVGKPKPRISLSNVHPISVQKAGGAGEPVACAYTVPTVIPPQGTANPKGGDHRGIKQRYYPMLGFGAFESAKHFCQAFDEVRNYFRPRSQMKEFVGSMSPLHPLIP